jgi:endonuclease/exonuclease/phosphatase family metal-dependent hydrolase
MRRLRLILKLLAGALLALVLAACALHVANSGAPPVPPKTPGALRVATHNVHYILLGRKSGPWSRGDWEERRHALDAAFKVLDADLVAFQEMESFSRGSDGGTNLARDWLLERNTGYAAAASGDWRSFPSTQPILYRTDRLRLVGQGWFFFSDTPDVIYSRTFNGSYPAFASWAEFAPVEGPRFRVVNVHTDFASRSNRRRSIALVASRIAPWIESGLPVILTGDLNEWRGSGLVDILEEAGLVFAPVKGATYHFDRGINLFGPIDHIAATADVEMAGPPMVLRRRFGGVWPSDHYPVLLDIRLPR